VLKATAAAPLPVQVVIDLPDLHPGKVIETPSVGHQQKPVYINPLEQHKVEITDPLRPGAAPVVETPAKDKNNKKWAERMIIIRKKKMKVHRRKRLWKKMWTQWKKKFYGRTRRREIEWRTKLNEAVTEAQKFDAEKYAAAYLNDYHYEFIPKTYKGKKKPQVVILDLLERDRQLKIREEMNNTNMKTGEKLVRQKETVQQFVQRHDK